MYGDVNRVPSIETPVSMRAKNNQAAEYHKRSNSKEVVSFQVISPQQNPVTPFAACIQ